MRPTWSGMISFGLVNIPVGLYPATEDKDLHFHLLHKDDEQPIKNQRVCSKDGTVVPSSDVVKGYEYEKGEFVVVSDEELKAVATKASENIVIMDFVDIKEIDPVFFEKPYYVKPDKKSTTAYSLLYQALRDTEKVGLANVAFRTRERLSALKAGANGLVLYTMHFADEVRDAEVVPVATDIGERELKMAHMLIDTMTVKFDPDRYKDTYTEALTKAIEQKLEGKAITPTAEKTEPTNVIDLMEFLKASIRKSDESASEKTAAADAKAQVASKSTRKKASQS